MWCQAYIWILSSLQGKDVSFGRGIDFLWAYPNEWLFTIILQLNLEKAGCWTMLKLPYKDTEKCCTGDPLFMTGFEGSHLSV